jgi:hypothetical protein
MKALAANPAGFNEGHLLPSIRKPDRCDPPCRAPAENNDHNIEKNIFFCLLF